MTFRKHSIAALAIVFFATVNAATARRVAAAARCSSVLKGDIPRVLYRSILPAAALLISTGSVSAQSFFYMPPHAQTNQAYTRGYWFVAPADFRITGLKVYDVPGGTNTHQNWAVVRFDNNTPPPLWQATTNAFVHLGVRLDEPAEVFSAADIDIFAGDVIGIYGNTMPAPAADTFRYSVTEIRYQVTVWIMGVPVDLFRSGMQFALGSALTPQMQDIWAVPPSQTRIGRIEVMYEPLDTPCYANCDGSTVEPVLNVDDFTCFINEFAQAQAFPHEQQITSYANCDQSTIAPVLNVDDFTCFINEFAAGCP